MLTDLPEYNSDLDSIQKERPQEEILLGKGDFVLTKIEFGLN
jgi:hypothetical protein